MYLLRYLVSCIVLGSYAYAEGSQSETYSASSSAPITAITGFYGGISIGASKLKAKLSKSKSSDTQTNKNKSKAGFLGDLFCGYNFQIGRFIAGVECTLGMESARPTTAIKNENNTQENTSLKRKYNFGLVPRIGYTIYGGLNAYMNLGTTFSKYQVKQQVSSKDGTTTNSKKRKSKLSLLVGLGLEQSFGPLFVRAECNKIFKRNISEINSTHVNSDSYVLKLGGGYRF